MPPQSVFCPGGESSQSGAAVRERYPGAIIESCGPVPIPFSKLETESGPFAIPIWNSHEGEVRKATDLWVCIEDQIIKITDVWAKTIDFWFVRRAGASTSYGKIGSVDVAKTQCSGFFQRMNATLEKCTLTNVAFDEYRKGASWDGVLVAPGQGEDHRLGQRFVYLALGIEQGQFLVVGVRQAGRVGHEEICKGRSVAICVVVKNYAGTPIGL